MSKRDKAPRQRNRLRAMMRGVTVSSRGVFKKLGTPLRLSELELLEGLAWRWRINVTFTWSCGKSVEYECDTNALHKLGELGNVIDQIEVSVKPPWATGQAERALRFTVLH